MPDPMTTTGTALASTGATTSAILLGASVAGVPTSVVLAAVLGAVIAAAQTETFELTRRGLIAGLVSFALALALGIWGGPLVAWVLSQLIEGFVRKPVPQGLADPLVALLLAGYGQRQILPFVLKRVGIEITNRGAQP